MQEAQYIFNQEATAGPGNFKQRKPQQVSNEQYEKLLKSGDYIEVYHGSKGEGVNGLMGKYYINNDLHVSGFGYYFTTNQGQAGRYSDDGNTVKALIAKSDIMYKYPNLSNDKMKGAEKYVGKYFKNGGLVTATDKKDYYNTSTVAAHKGYKVAEGGTLNGHKNLVVIDRSALIVKKK